MTTRITYAPNAEHCYATKGLAHSNTAIHALIDGIKDSLTGCSIDTTWDDVAIAHYVADKLLKVYCLMNGKKDGDDFELPTDREGSGDARMVFNVQGI